MGLRARYGGQRTGGHLSACGVRVVGVVGGGALKALDDHAETTQCLRGGLATSCPPRSNLTPEGISGSVVHRSARLLLLQHRTAHGRQTTRSRTSRALSVPPRNLQQHDRSCRRGPPRRTHYPTRGGGCRTTTLHMTPAGGVSEARFDTSIQVLCTLDGDRRPLRGLKTRPRPQIARSSLARARPVMRATRRS